MSDTGDTGKNAFHDDLTERLRIFEYDRDTYQVEKVLKVTDDQRTERVKNPQGETLIRKHFFIEADDCMAFYRKIQQIDCPELPRIREVYRVPGGTVVIREYLSGFTAREWVEDNGPMDASDARNTMMQICRGVKALHSCRPPIIHRDINPGNVIITSHGARLIDFGIARQYDQQVSRDTQNWGTVGYAAPEQYGFGQSDQRTDVFALGMLYWFLLTGKDPEANLSAALNRPDADRHGVNETTCRIIAKATAFSPDDRYMTVEHLMRRIQSEENSRESDRRRRQTAGNAAPDDDGQPGIDTGGINAAAGEGTAVGEAAPSLLKRIYPGKGPAAGIWMLVSTGFVFLLIIGMLLDLMDTWGQGTPANWLGNALEDTAILLIFAPAYVLTNNLLGIIDRIPFLHEHPIKSSIIVVLAAFVLGCLIVILC